VADRFGVDTQHPGDGLLVDTTAFAQHEETHWSAIKGFLPSALATTCEITLDVNTDRETAVPPQAVRRPGVHEFGYRALAPVLHLNQFLADKIAVEPFPKEAIE
jgi:hypothetical protein